MSGQVDKINSKLRFINYYVNNVEFYNNINYNDEPVEIDFKISKQIDFTGDQENTVLVTLIASIFEDAEKNSYPFSMKLSITGVFQIDNIEDDSNKKLAQINSISILFPYLRSMVTTYSANANVAPLILPPINVVKLVSQDNSLNN